MEEANSDIFIIGGGINGVGIANDAAGRGLSVTLCDKNDLASATSSASSKLIHGGLRYLENYDFCLVRTALQEREILLHNAPHLISPLEFVLPHAKHLRPAWMIRLGLFIYDHLAAHPQLPNSSRINLSDDPRGSALKKEFKTGFSYYDCSTDDARLVITNAIAARENHARILPRTECLSADFENARWKLTLRNTITNEIKTEHAKVLVNASGPWICEIQKNIIHVKNDLAVELIKGSHIITPKLYEGDFAYILQNPDNRIVFAIPYQQDYTLIGTTDVAYTGDLNHVTMSDEEEHYLLDTINQYFEKKLKAEDITWSYAGVRCLAREEKNNLSQVSREYKFQFLKETPLLTVISGKVTTYRRLSKDAVDAFKEIFPGLKPSLTKDKILPGGDLHSADFSDFYHKMRKQYHWLPESLVLRLSKSYGSRIHLILQNATALSDLGQPFAHGLYQKEIEYLRKYEWAMTTDDILWRRTKLGLFFNDLEVADLKKWLEAH